MSARLLLLVALTLPGTALAQDDPWSPPSTSSDDESESEEEDTGEDDEAGDSDEPFGTQPAPPAAAQDADEEGADDEWAPPGLDDDNDEDDDSAAGDANMDAPTDDTSMPAPEPANTGLAGGNVPMGLRIGGWGAGSGVDVAQAFVVGSNGGTNQTTGRVRWSKGRVGVQVGLPFVAYRLPRQPRDTGLGNLQLDLWYGLKETDRGWTGIGVEGHANVASGARAYTWVHDADDIWPGYGLDLAVQSRRTSGRITRMARVAVGVRSGRDFDPWTASYLTFEGAVGADVALGERFGLVGETSFAYWDLSPWDLTGLVRADVSKGLRFRGGIVVPMAVWVGATRMDEQFRGVREVTALMDLSLAL